MNRIKILMLTTALALASAGYAAGNGKHVAKQSGDMKTGASCCTHDGHCCKGGSSCPVHKSDQGQAQSTQAADDNCCTGGDCCTAHVAKK
jgi:hypothetical protein